MLIFGRGPNRMHMQHFMKGPRARKPNCTLTGNEGGLPQKGRFALWLLYF